MYGHPSEGFSLVHVLRSRAQQVAIETIRLVENWGVQRAGWGRQAGVGPLGAQTNTQENYWEHSCKFEVLYLVL